MGDPIRLRIVDELAVSDRAPVELRNLFDLESNLLAHHLDALERVGLINRTRSSGDGRRRYVHLLRSALDGLTVGRAIERRPPVFVCTRNSARSQLAAALWRDLDGSGAASAGTHPAGSVHRGAVDAAQRAGLDFSDAFPKSLDEIDISSALVITVCDQAHEELEPLPGWLHWSIPDPVPGGSSGAFDAAVAELRNRITNVLSPGAAA